MEVTRLSPATILIRLFFTLAVLTTTGAAIGWLLGDALLAAVLALLIGLVAVLPALLMRPQRESRLSLRSFLGLRRWGPE
jgi:hypothetical protein